MTELQVSTQKPNIVGRSLFGGGAAALIVYFLWFAAAGVRAGFSPDDLMNMHLAFVRGTAWKHIVDGVLFFMPASRPVGAALYRFAYDAAGMNPALLHVLCVALALVNVYLLFRVTRLISGSAEIGLLATLIGAFHGNFLPLYYNAGNCYDLLSFSFFYTALAMYVGVRRRGAAEGARETIAILLLFALALGAKEIALSFPLILLAYEICLGGIAPRSVRTAVLCGVMAAVFVAVRVYGPDGLAYIGAYRPAVGTASYVNAMGVLLNDLFYRVGWFNAARTIAFWGMLAAIAALARSKYLAFCLAWVLLGFLPIAFVPPRGLAAAYVPLAGLWAYTAGALVAAGKYASDRARAGERARLAVRTVIFCAVLAALGWVHRANCDLSWITGEEDEIGLMTRQLESLHLPLAPGALVLMVNDPFRERSWGQWSSFFLLRLYYHDPLLELEQCSRLEPEAPGAYAAVLSYEQGRLVKVSGCVGRSCCSTGGRR